MLIVLEIVLTAAAFKRGWKALAFAPLACVLVLGAAMGVTMGSTATQLAPLVDLVGIIVLGVMVAVRKPAAQVPPVQSPFMNAQAPFMNQAPPQGSVFVNPVYVNPVQVNPSNSVPSQTTVPPNPFAQPYQQ